MANGLSSSIGDSGLIAERYSMAFRGAQRPVKGKLNGSNTEMYLLMANEMIGTLERCFVLTSPLVSVTLLASSKYSRRQDVLFPQLHSSIEPSLGHFYVARPKGPVGVWALSSEETRKSPMHACIYK